MLESALKEQLKGIFAGLEANFAFDISVSSSPELLSAVFRTDTNLLLCCLLSSIWMVKGRTFPMRLFVTV